MGIDDLNKFRIILGSRSPRRQELLRELGLKFEVVIKDWEEDYPEDLSGPEIALYVAERKALSFLPEIGKNEIVITADTIVWCDGEVLSKPADKEDALRIIRKISGRTHEVITGVCLLSSDKMVSFQSCTRVTFSDLSDEEIVHYISRYKPYDKAGAYGIQEWIGIAACSSIEGSYFNVVGLPVEQVYRELKKFVS
jgi:septum formation protein